MASEWIPLENGTQIRNEDGDILAEIEGNTVIVWASDLEEPFTVPLELWDSIRICRRATCGTAAQPGVPAVRRADADAAVNRLAELVGEAGVQDLVTLVLYATELESRMRAEVGDDA